MTSTQKLAESSILDTHLSEVSLQNSAYWVILFIIAFIVIINVPPLVGMLIFLCSHSQIDGKRYWFYEYLVRKSPTKTVCFLLSFIIWI